MPGVKIAQAAMKIELTTALNSSTLRNPKR